ncbi:MAG: TniQ family protein [Variovorax sp.]
MSDRTLFYPQELPGHGTGRVQSLRSYVEHLALAHSMKPRALVEVLFRKFPVEGVSAREMADIVLRGKLNSGLPAALRFQKSLEGATGCSLADATLGQLTRVFAPTGLTRPYKKPVCCPVCVRDGEELPFMPLLWDFQSVTACPSHKVKLVPIPKCGAPASEQLAHQERPTLSGVCAHCGSIGYKCAHLEAEEASSQEVWVATEVEQLLAARGALASDVSDASLRAGIRALVSERFNGSVVRASVESGLSRSLVCTWLKGSKPTLPWVLQLCHHAGVSIVALVGGKVQEADIKGAAGGETQRVVPRKYERTQLSRAEIEDRLQAALLMDHPPTIRDFAKQHTLKERLLRDWFPKEVRALGELTVERQNRDSQARYLTALEAYRAAAELIQTRGDAVHTRTLQQVSGIVAFSRNSNRVRAIEDVLAQYKPPLIAVVKGIVIAPEERGRSSQLHELS